MTRTIVGILRGGNSSEYALSLKTGAEMLRALPDDRYDVRDILLDKTGAWHVRGQAVTPARALTQVDVVLNALHGGVGEDGTVQRILERSGVPYAGSRAPNVGFALNKVRSRQLLRKSGIRMPRAATFSIDNGLNTGEMATVVFEQFGPPYVVKPPSEGASRGIRVVPTLTELPDAIGDIIDDFGTAIIEEYVRGDEASVGIIENFRSEDLYALPPAHVLKDGLHVTEAHHHEGTMRHIVPSRFSYEQKISLADVARTAHRVLGLSHYSRSDLIVAPRGIYLLEVNAHPGLYTGATFPSMLESVGSSVLEFLEHAIHLARSAR